MLQSRGDGDLALEAIGRDLPGELRRQHLDDDLPAQRALLCEEDAGHAAAGELALDGVGILQRGCNVVRAGRVRRSSLLSLSEESIAHGALASGIRGPVDKDAV